MRLLDVRGDYPIRVVVGFFFRLFVVDLVGGRVVSLLRLCEEEGGEVPP